MVSFFPLKELHAIIFKVTMVNKMEIVDTLHGLFSIDYKFLIGI